MAGTSGEQQTSTLIVKFKSADADEFVSRHGQSVSLRGIFLQTPKPPRLGLRLRFEIRSRSGAPILSGFGHVAWRRPSAADPAFAPGVGIAFEELDATSRELVARIVRERGSATSLFDEDAHAERVTPKAAPAEASKNEPAHEPAHEPIPEPAAPSPATPERSQRGIPPLGAGPAPAAPRIPPLATARIVPLGAGPALAAPHIPPLAAARIVPLGAGPAPAAPRIPPLAAARTVPVGELDVSASAPREVLGFEDIEVDDAEEARVSVEPGAPSEDFARSEIDESDPTIPLRTERADQEPRTATTQPRQTAAERAEPPAPAAMNAATALREVAVTTDGTRSDRPSGASARSVALMIGLAALAGAGFFAWQGMLARQSAATPQEVRVAPATYGTGAEPPPSTPSPAVSTPAADAATPPDAASADAASESLPAGLGAPAELRDVALGAPGVTVTTPVASEPETAAVEEEPSDEEPTARKARRTKRRRREGGLSVAQACLAEGDNACVIRALAGQARTPRELALLIETYRATGDAEKARTSMQEFVSRFPDEIAAERYRRVLAK